jgi:uncharacterized Zn-binding protein involved in type VI secretion
MSTSSAMLQQYTYNGYTTTDVAVSGNAYGSCIVRLTDTSTLFIGQGQACVLTKDSFDNLIAGPMAQFSASAAAISAVVLNSTTVFIAYADFANNAYGTGVIATISGTSITFGPPNVFTSNYCGYAISAAALNSTSVFISYQLNPGGYGIVATVSGTTISYGTAAEFLTTAISGNNLCCSTLTPTSVFIVYGSGSYQISGVVASLSGTTITYGTVVNYSTNYGGGSEALLSQTIACVATSSTNVGVMYANQYNSSIFYGNASISGTTVTFNSFTYSEQYIPSGAAVTMQLIPGSNNATFMAYFDNNGLYFLPMNYFGSTSVSMGKSIPLSATTGAGLTNVFSFCFLTSNSGVMTWANKAAYFTTDGANVYMGAGDSVLSGDSDHTEISSLYMYNNGPNNAVVYLLVGQGNTIDLTKTIWKETISAGSATSIVLPNSPIVITNGYNLYIYESGNISGLTQINLSFFGISVTT